MVSISIISTWGLAVEDLRSKKTASCLLCNVGIVQLTKTTDCRQKQVPQARFPGFNLHTQYFPLFFIVFLWNVYNCTFRSSIIWGVCHL